MCNWWPEITEEVELLGKGVGVVFCTGERFVFNTRPQGLVSSRVSAFKEIHGLKVVFGHFI